MPKTDPYLENLKAARARLTAKLADPNLSEEARLRATIHLKGSGLPKGHDDYCEGVEEAIAAIEKQEVEE